MARPALLASAAFAAGAALSYALTRAPAAAPAPPRLVDLSHTLESPMPSIFSQAAQPKLRHFFSHADSAKSGKYSGCTCELTETTLIGSTATYLDAPYHFHPGRRSLAELPLSKLVLPGVVVDCTGVAGAGEELPASVLDGCDVRGKAVLLRTDWSRHWGTPEYAAHPFVGRALADALVRLGAELVAIDTLLIDTMEDPERPAHATLLGQDICIVENGCEFEAAQQLGAFTFVANALKVQQGPSFPVRAFAFA